MADNPETDTTTCDRCEKSVHWLATKRWRVVFDKCYCTVCAKLMDAAPRPRAPSYTDLIQSDIQYHGDPYHG